MGWVTLEDGQHVLIGPGGKTLATRAQISSASGGKERGKALAGKSKGAVARAVAKARASKQGEGLKLSPKGPPKRQGLRSAFPGGSQYLDPRMKAPTMVEALMKKQKWTDKDVARVDKWTPLLGQDRDELARSATRAAEDYRRIKGYMGSKEESRDIAIGKGAKDSASGKLYKDNSGNFRLREAGSQSGKIAPYNKELKAHEKATGKDFFSERPAAKQQSPATTRAVEHARAAAAKPSLREQAEKARAAPARSAESIRKEMSQIDDKMYQRSKLGRNRGGSAGAMNRDIQRLHEKKANLKALLAKMG